jgi:hypothetical protein
MKKINILFVGLMAFSITFLGCKKDELQPFKANSAINFAKIENLNSVTYSFMANPTNEYIQEIPVLIMGDSSAVDRTFNVEVVKDSNTTAQPAQYEIIGGLVEAGKFTGKLKIKLLNSKALDTETVSVKVKLVDSKDFKAGNIETSDFTVKWTNQIVLPSWTYFRLFFVSASSNSAYRLIIQVTGLTTLTAAQYSRDIGAAGVEALATKFGDYVKQWNKDNPTNKLKHDTGTQAGQEIVPLYYTHSKFD